MNEREKILNKWVDCTILFVTTHETGHYIVGRNSRVCEKIKSLSSFYDENNQSLGKFVYECKPLKRRQDYVEGIAITIAGIVATRMFLTEEFIENIFDIIVTDKAELKQARKLALEYCYKSRKFYRIYINCPRILKKKFLKMASDKILKEAEELAQKIISEHKDQYIKIRNELIKKRELTGEELEKLYNENLKK